ncbi:hypothetical protein N7461_007179 [Penicillium sp. DV-2018c]|nr:hypothetical protein N7461_007179 [Penicillium sp. DV-2018c]
MDLPPMLRVIRSSPIFVHWPLDVPPGVSGISSLPISLQSLVEGTEYPPQTPTLLQATTTKIVMIVENVSPTPFALLRRARNFEYRDDGWHLQEFANYEDPTLALTDEYLRVLKCISSANQSRSGTTASDYSHLRSLMKWGASSQKGLKFCGVRGPNRLIMRDPA